MRIKELIAISFILSIFTTVFFNKIIFTDRALVATDCLGQYRPWKIFPAYQNRPHNPNLSDVVDSAYPMRHYVSEMIKKKIQPLWDSTILCGAPFLANNESGLFNPFYILFNIFPISKAFGYVSILQVFLAGLFMYLFMRGIEVRPFGSLIASITYMFNSFFIIWMWHLGIISVALWLPLILLFTEKFLQTKNTIYSIIAGIVFGVQFLCGFIQLSLYIIISTLIYTFIRIIQLKPKKILTYLRGVLLVFIIGFGLGAMQLIPTFELIGLSQRGIYPYDFSRLFDFSSLLHLLSFIFPNIFGSPMDHNYWGVPNYSEMCGYLGILPFIFALVALLYRKDRWTFIFFIIGAFALTVYLDTPLNGLLSISIPGYSKGIAPNRIIFLYLFSGSILAGLGVDYLESNKQIKSKLKLLTKYIAIIIMIIIVFISLFILSLKIWGQNIVNIILSLPFCNAGTFSSILERVFNKIDLVPGIIRHYYLLKPVIYLPLALIFISIWLLRYYFKKGNSFIFRIVTISIIIFDLFYFGMHYLTTVDKETVFPKLECVDFLEKDNDLFRIISLGDVFPKNTIVPYNIQTIEGYVSLFSKRYEELCLSIDETSKIGNGIGIEFAYSVVSSPLLNLHNVKYILTDERIKDGRFKLVYDKDILIYENKAVLPRAFIVPKIKVIKDKESIFKELNSVNFNPREYIILEEEPNVELAKQTQIDSEVIINKYSPNEVILNARLSDNGFLFLSDTYYPGWRVYIDGAIGKVYCADYTFRAVYLKKGEHKVRFLYDPKSFKIGKAISIYTFLLLIAGLTVPLSIYKTMTDV